MIAINLTEYGDLSCYDFSGVSIYQTVVDSISEEGWMNTVSVFRSFSNCM
jgi:hypothetical protein